MSYNDDAKMKLLKEAWQKMEEGDATYGAKVPGATDPDLKNVKTSGTGVKQLPKRDTVAKATAGAENLAEEEDTGVPASAEEIGTGEAPEVDADAALADAGVDATAGAEVPTSPWDQLVAAVEQLKTALEAVAAEEKGEEEHAGLGAEGDTEVGAEVGAETEPEQDIAEVAQGYLNEAKKKIAEKQACKEEEACKEEKKGFVPSKKVPAPKKK